MFTKARPSRSILSCFTLQHLVNERPKVHLDGVEFTLDYRDGVRKVVDNLGKGLANLGGCERALPRDAAVAVARFLDVIDACTRRGSLMSGRTGITAASRGLRDAPT